MEANRDCYTFQKIGYTDGFLQKSIDATYILTMEKSPRIPDVMNKLKDYHPSNCVYIVLNKGFKTCTKQLPKQNSIYDIIDANLQIFRHASENKYENILILEDDFIFEQKIKDPVVQENIHTFMKSHQSTSFMYLLGCLPIIFLPYSAHTHRIIWALATHAVIYSKEMRNEILEYSKSNQINDWDLDIGKLCLWEHKKFMYKIPLCNQIMEATENRQNWAVDGITRYILNTYIELTKFNKYPEPATSIVYVLAYLLSFIALLVIIFILYAILKFVFINTKLGKNIVQKTRRR
jgi:hypothetical protein